MLLNKEFGNLGHACSFLLLCNEVLQTVYRELRRLRAPIQQPHRLALFPSMQEYAWHAIDAIAGIDERYSCIKTTP